MNSRIIGIIVRREYLNRVKKKSFLVTTFLVPVLFAAMCLLPSLIMFGAKEESKVVAVADASGIVLPVLENTETVTYEDCSGHPLDSVKRNLAAFGYDAVLEISPLDTAGKTVSAAIYSTKPLGVDMTENIGNRIDYAVEEYRVDSYGIEGLGEIMDAVKADVRLRSYTIEDDGEAKAAESGVYMIVSMVLGMIIYMFIAVFGGMVMSSVIEEKSSRVVEVLISSVKATELMFGKIIGIAMVALTQFLLWVVLTVAIVGVVGAVAGPSLFSGADPAEMVQMSGMDPAMAETAMAAASDQGEASVLLSSLANIPFGQIVICFIVFFVFGYMLYASGNTLYGYDFRKSPQQRVALRTFDAPISCIMADTETDEKYGDFVYVATYDDSRSRSGILYKLQMTDSPDRIEAEDAGKWDKGLLKIKDMHYKTF